MKSLILIAGLVLLSGSLTFNLHQKEVEAQKANTAKTTVQVEKGFFDQDKRN